MWRVVVTEDFHALEDVHALGIDGYENLRLLLVRWRVWTRLHHSNHDLTAWITGT